MKIWFGLFLCLCYNLYFMFLLPQTNTAYLIYLDILLGVCGLLYGLAEGLKKKHRREKKAKFLQFPSVIYQNFPEMEFYDIAEHDVLALQDQLKEQFELNQDLQDYIAKWCHEVKIPLAASLLMAERIEDGKLRGQMQEQLERINQQLKSALLGCKVQSSLFDIQIKSVSLLECVKTSVKNNRFFLIKNHFQVVIEAEDALVYTDKNWLVYVLDQLISNAIKYTLIDHPEGVSYGVPFGYTQRASHMTRSTSGQLRYTSFASGDTCPDGTSREELAGDAVIDKPCIRIWSERKEAALKDFSVLCSENKENDSGASFLRLFIEDNGEGIKDSDIRRIFEKGYTGSNHHNGKYKSTGMGLYMAARILEKLGHRIFVESEEGKYTRFGIDFCEEK